ncbi:MAG: adenylate/guanylate cyclase domain-containing protein [Verrucomicrobiota bacterium]|nr:adenylate/guanylate cyclase domain-containing protein [Verrucomicrobiota bacterium]
MKSHRNRLRNYFKLSRRSIIASVLTCLVGLAFVFLPLGRSLRQYSYDLPFMLFRSSGTVSNIAIVQMDDRSFQDLEQSPASFDRALHGHLVDHLQQFGARLAAFDILFLDKSGAPESDAAFYRASTNFGNVILGAGLFSRKQNGVTETKLERAVPPLEALPFGLASIAADADREARRIYSGTERFRSLPFKVAEMLGVSTTNIGGPNQEMWLNYYGPHPFLKIPYAELLLAPEKWSNAVAGKVIFIGRATEAGYAGEEKEQFRSPWTPLDNDFVYGVEVHALTLANVLNGDWLKRSPAAEIVIIVLVGLGLGFFLPQFGPLVSILVAFGTAFLIFGTGCATHLQFNWWFAWLIPVAIQVPVALGCSITASTLQAYVEVKNLEHSLSLHLSPERARQLAKRRELLEPGAHPQVISILFSDIQSFSTICDRTRLGELMQLLNQYFEAVLPCVKDTNGTVIKLIGDAVFAVWNAPEPQPNHAELACRAALLLRERLIEFEAENESFRLKTRVGMHTGEASVGNIGSRERFDYTAVGPAINLAARLEGLNKYLGTDILLTDDLLEHVPKLFVTRPVGHFRFKGLDRVVKIHELIGNLDVAESSKPWREKFREGMRKFCDGEFSAAQVTFEEILAMKASDGPSIFYRDFCIKYQKHPPSEWLGEIKMDEK